MSEVILIQANELREILAEVIRTEVKKPKKEEQESREYLTREEVSSLLRVSLVTLHSWNAKGILSPIKIEGRVLYPAGSVNRLLARKTTPRKGQ